MANAPTLGNDVIRGTKAADVIFGDAVDLSSLPQGTRAGNDIILGFGGDDTLVGDARRMIDGRGGNDTLAGGPGNDTLLGDVGDGYGSFRGGNDELRGGLGNDLIDGDGNMLPGIDSHPQGGNDRLFGGEGADAFRFVGAFGNDTVKDFRQGEDILDILVYDATYDESGNVVGLSLLGAAQKDDVDIHVECGSTVISVTGITHGRIVLEHFTGELQSSDFGFMG